MIRVPVVGMNGTEYVFPCYFLGDPNKQAARPATASRNLLGLTGVVAKVRLSFDGKAVPAAPYGNLVIEK